MISGLAGFILMGVDKSRALDRAWRVPERTFFTLALVGGAFGILLGSGIFRHKTRKSSFIGLILILVILWIAVLTELVRYLGPPIS
jgi:uncharacterized membrane protein YsdA (DUF1294 family)